MPGSRAFIAAAVAALALGAAVTPAGPAAARAQEAPDAYAVGVHRATFIDTSRSTSANGDLPESSERLLDTVILYPAKGEPGAEAATAAPVEGAAPAEGPFPLVVFAHGLGGSLAYYAPLMQQWASAGYVVAAPNFPLTNAETQGAVDPGDFRNQPGDVSFVITSVLKAGKGADEPLAGLVDRRRVGVAGHSLGGITTLGIAAHTCCHDERVRAAIVLAGDPLSFPKGRFDYRNAPPMLLVHGTEDSAVTYDASIDVFNRARSPKGIVTVLDGDHGSPVAPSNPAFASVVRATTDFLDGYVQGDRAARRRIAEAAEPGVTEIRFETKPGKRATIPTTPREVRDLKATVTPRRNLEDGQDVTVTWSGFTPGKTINIVQCSSTVPGDAAACDLQSGYILQPNPTGEGSLPLGIVTGAVGTGTCDAEHDCDIVVNDGGSLDPEASVRITVSFAS